MTTFAISNVNGDYKTLLQLLKIVHFDKTQDQLWFSGNLVNGGSDSLAVLRFVKELDKQAACVLGGQELRLLAIADGIFDAAPNDTFTDILTANDCDELLKWLRNRPFLKHGLGYTLVNAGIPAEWSLSQALTLAMEAEVSLSMGNHKVYLENMYIDGPTRWHAKHRGWKRVRFITNAFTRLGYYNENGRVEFNAPNPKSGQPPNKLTPWYRMENRAMANQNIIFGISPGSEDKPVPGIFPLSHTDKTMSALKLSPQPVYFHV